MEAGAESLGAYWTALGVFWKVGMALEGIGASFRSNRNPRKTFRKRGRNRPDGPSEGPEKAPGGYRDGFEVPLREFQEQWENLQRVPG